MRTAPRLRLVTPGLAAHVLPLREAGVLEDAELHTIDIAASRYGEARLEVLVALALALRAARVGHAGVDLAELEHVLDDEPAAAPVASAPAVGDRPGDDEAADPADAEAPSPPAAATVEERLRALGLPTTAAEVAAWNAAVAASPLVGSGSDAVRPFWRQRRAGAGEAWLLLTRRMWREQERLADALKELAASAPAPAFDAAGVEARLHALFSKAEDAPIAAAVRRGLDGRLSLVTGGPGTGKTYSIKCLLGALVGLHGTASPLRIALAAPTGKAAVRMREALLENLASFVPDEPARAQLRALAPSTVHKLLGGRPDGTFRHGPSAPIAHDVVVVDEVSMVGLALMRRLVEALPDGARLVLLGDPAQLASVDAGTVLADLVGADGGAVEPRITRFTEAHRFKNAELRKLIETLQKPTSPNVAAALATLKASTGETSASLRWLGASTEGRPSEAQLHALAAPYLAPRSGYARRLADHLAEGGGKSAALRDPEEQRALLDALGAYRVLAVHRRGPLGVAGLLGALDGAIRSALRAALARHGGPAELPGRGGHWLGEPILVTRNDYEVDLRNGDIGLVLPGDDGQLTAVFPVQDGERKTVRRVPLSRLPPHGGALAMTVHKAQGSQFDHVALVLAGRASPIQTRELVYTAITRAQARLDWLGSGDELEVALSTPIRRTSGLRELLAP
jgi:exodeoxyribonuclease V alpha subunit